MDTDIRAALVKAGWHPLRKVSPFRWTRPLEEEGFEFNDAALAILAEFGGIRVLGLSRDGIRSSLDFDPYDAASGSLDEAETLAEDYGENYSPIGTWSGQYATYVGESGRLLAMGPGWDWELGKTLYECLELVVLRSRTIKCVKTRVPGVAPFPPE